MKKKTGKNIVKILVILIVTILSVYYVLKDDPIRTFSFLGEVHFFPFLLALALACLTPVLDGIVLTFFTRLYNRRYRFSQGLVNTIIGSFIGCIYKTGAMFIQAYTFTKQDVKGAHAASILTMQFLMYQITFTLYSLIMVFVGYPFVRDIPIEGCGKCLSFGYIKRKQHEISEEYDLFLGMLRDHLCKIQNAVSPPGASSCHQPA